MDTHVPGGEALFGLLARLADNKYALGRRYAEWCSSAPTLESSVAAAAMAQDELGHARALYPLLRTLDAEAGPEIDPETRTDFLTLAALERPFASWLEFVAANVLIDPAMTVIFEAARDASYEPLAGRSRKVLEEERLHTLHGIGWVRRLTRAVSPAREGEVVRAALREALLADWAQTLCWFGPEGGEDPLARAGVLDAPPDALRARFLAVIGPTIEAAGLALPLRRAGNDGWELTEPLPWGRWDAATYRVRTSKPAAEPAPAHGA
ncbi:MAG: phenylacetate-CoA oxygenase subunit PaaI [Ktedonobacterales bacterium]|nr:phenylacetate-CoA oxygenase subunit PaaI [Ktedonobacterales bacterium]